MRRIVTLQENYGGFFLAEKTVVATLTSNHSCSQTVGLYTLTDYLQFPSQSTSNLPHPWAYIWKVYYPEAVPQNSFVRKLCSNTLKKNPKKTFTVEFSFGKLRWSCNFFQLWENCVQTLWKKIPRKRPQWSSPSESSGGPAIFSKNSHRVPTKSYDVYVTIKHNLHQTIYFYSAVFNCRGRRNLIIPSILFKFHTCWRRCLQVTLLWWLNA